MAQHEFDDDGYHLEVIGTAMTNTQEGSQHTQVVPPPMLWSYAQEEALMAVSEQGRDRAWRLVTDPERRAKRIAARYADLYFKSAEKSRGKLQFYWPALAAFVVKDIVEAFRYTREGVLAGGIDNMARTSAGSQIVSQLFTEASPYEHAMRVYTALAKGNLWLFQDVYPWLWFVLEYGLNRDGSFNAGRLKSHVGQRNAQTYQYQSREAVKHLAFGAAWLGRLMVRIGADPVYPQARSYFDAQPNWGGLDGGYGQHQAKAFEAHAYVRRNVKDFDGGYRTPPSRYWIHFKEAFYVMEEERRELTRVASDSAGTARLEKIAKFQATKEVREAYDVLTAEYGTSGEKQFEKQKKELVAIAAHEQLNVLQPVIYDEPELVKTMDINHLISRASLGALSPTYTLYFSAAPKNDDPDLQVTFDEPKDPWDYLTGPKKSLPDPVDRMKYVGEIAKAFNDLMFNQRTYMEAELRKIQGWLNA